MKGCHLKPLLSVGLVLSLSLGLSGLANASTVTIGGPGSPLSSNAWSLTGPRMDDWIGAVEDPANFGPGGIVPHTVDVVAFTSGPLTAADLSTIDIFVSPWWFDVEAGPSVTAVVDWFMGGGNLLLLQDDAGTDAIGDALGIPTVGSTDPDHIFNDGPPLFDGPFGIAIDPTQGGGSEGFLSEADVLAAGGTVAGTNSGGMVIGAIWGPGVYAPGTGAMVIVADVDTFSDITATYSPALDANGIFALNTTAFLVGAAVPEPASLALLGLALAALGFSRRSRPH